MRNRRTPLLDVVDGYFIHRHDLSSATRTNYQRRFNDYATWVAAQLGRDALIGDLEGGLVEAFLSHLRVTTSAQTARSAWVALRSLAAFLAERRILSDHQVSVLRSVRMPRIKDESRRALTDDEMWKLLAVASETALGNRDSAMVWTLLGCGLRRAELVALRVSDVSLHERKLHVSAGTSKSIHSRDCTIPIETAKALDTYLASRQGPTDDDSPLFSDRLGHDLNGDAVRKLFARLRVRTGIHDLCAHMLRHTWATNFHRSRSGTARDLMTEGGWTTGRMVDRYTKSRPFEERRTAPSPFTATRRRRDKRPLGKWTPPKRSGLDDERSA